jgi:hypothetical protein
MEELVMVLKAGPGNLVEGLDCFDQLYRMVTLN